MKNDILESEAFYNLMQAYRHAPISGQEKTVEAYEAVKEFIRYNYIPEEVEQDIPEPTKCFDCKDEACWEEWGDPNRDGDSCIAIEGSHFCRRGWDKFVEHQGCKHEDIDYLKKKEKF